MAKYNMIEPKPRHWPELMKLGLLPGVDSVEEYEARVSMEKEGRAAKWGAHVGKRLSKSR
jgi:hypothetical protein